MLKVTTKASLNNIRSIWKNQIAHIKANTAKDHLFLILSKVSLINQDLELPQEKLEELLSKELRKAFTASGRTRFSTTKENIVSLATSTITNNSSCLFESILNTQSNLIVNLNAIAELSAVALKITKEWE